MKIFNYCVVFFVPLHGTTDDIYDISIDSHRIMKGKGISLISFSSTYGVKEISKILKNNERNFLIFNLDDEMSGFNLTDKEKESEFFGFINNVDSFEQLKKNSDDLLDDLSKTNFKHDLESTNNFEETYNYLYGKKTPLNYDFNNEFLDIDFENLSSDEKNYLINGIIDKGIENLNDNDKKVLNRLSKLL